MLHYEFHITALCIYDRSGVFRRPRHRKTIHKFISTPMPISMFSAPLISDNQCLATTRRESRKDNWRWAMSRVDDRSTTDARLEKRLENKSMGVNSKGRRRRPLERERAF